MPDSIPGSHLEPTDEISLETVKKRTVSGIVILTGRTFLLSVIALFATGLLTVYLDPSDFGIFWIVSAIVNFLAYFSDIGLAAALIQKKEKLTRADQITTFTVQQILVFTILIVIYLSRNLIINYYGLDNKEILLLYALAVSLVLSSFKTIPSVILERKLEFGKLVVPQVLENLTYNILAVFLAWKGYGLMSFTYAVLARGIVGFISMYIIQPWLPGLRIKKDALGKLLKYGIPYQANTFLATIKDDGMTAVLGGILGASGLGYLGWAQKWGQAPLRFFMDHVIKVTFPAFSRLQDDRDHLKLTVERSIFFICFLVFPSLVGLLILAPVLVDIIPRYEKWQPALTAFYLIGITTVFSSVTTQITNLLNAIGRIKITFKLMVMWTILTWIFVPVMAAKYGVNGAALAYAIVSSSSIVAIFLAKRYVEFNLSKAMFKPFISSILMGLVLVIARSMVNFNVAGVVVLILSGLLSYLLSMYILSGSKLVSDIGRSVKILFKK